MGVRPRRKIIPVSGRRLNGGDDLSGAPAARRDLLAIYRAAVDSVAGDTAVSRHLSGETGPPIAAVAIGKAASAMLRGLVDAVGDRLQAGLLISKDGHADAAKWRSWPVEVIESAHPVPDERSLWAGEALIAFIRRQPPDRPIWFLVSGGASALVEVLRPGLSLADLRAANAWLLGSGLDIERMNRLRAGLSQIKAGGLLRYLGGRPTRLLLISDVPGDDPAAIGSGLLVPSGDSSPDWTPEALDGEPPPACLRDSLSASSAVSPTAGPAPTPEIVADLDRALAAARTEAGRLGYRVTRHSRFLCGDAETTGRELARALERLDEGVHLWGGETTVRLPERPGRGGRNQHLALAAAVELAGAAGRWLLAAGTDGSDGPTEDAGALVDGGTVSRGESGGADALDALARADAGRFLELSGDLLSTGPTGTNVMDLVIALKQGRDHE